MKLEEQKNTAEATRPLTDADVRSRFYTTKSFRKEDLLSKSVPIECTKALTFQQPIKMREDGDQTDDKKSQNGRRD